jgi:hypothetical protein
MLARAAERIRREIEDFVPPEPHPDQLGTPLPPEWFASELDKMRAALLEPYVIVEGDDARPDCDGLRVVIVAQDEETLLAFDPSPDGDFVLIFRRAAGVWLSSIRGGAVDTFLSR